MADLTQQHPGGEKRLSQHERAANQALERAHHHLEKSLDLLNVEPTDRAHDDVLLQDAIGHISRGIIDLFSGLVYAINGVASDVRDQTDAVYHISRQ